MPRIDFQVSPQPPERAVAEMLVLPCFGGPAATLAGGPGVAQVSQALRTDLVAILGAARAGGGLFRGELGETFETLTLGAIPAPRLLLVGLGDPGACGPQAIRHAAMMAARRMRTAVTIATTIPAAAAVPSAAVAPAGVPGGKVPGGAAAAASAFAEGLLLGAYHFGRYQAGDPGSSSPAPVLRQVTVLSGGPADPVQAGLDRGARVAEATNWVRDLVTTPAADATPAIMTAQARQLAADCGLSCTVTAGRDLARGGFGGILGVGQGSANQPALVELTYRGDEGGPVLALTGKGITFDSGGLSLKRTAEIEWMKSDMAGAATVLAVVRLAAELGLPVNLHAALPFAENMPGGTALRPGDVITHYGGRTSEVLDTDCEGRLVIADALAYLSARQPAALIDVATLTDAAGLGDALFAVMGNDPGLIAAVLAAGEEAGDPGWQLPLPAAYRQYLDSAVADIRNLPRGVPDSTVLAGLYLRDFAGNVPWVHIDNGSTAYLELATDCWPEGATGSPTRALLRWVETASAHRGPGDAVVTEP